jgi:hypothetical protein
MCSVKEELMRVFLFPLPLTLLVYSLQAQDPGIQAAQIAIQNTQIAVQAAQQANDQACSACIHYNGNFENRQSG